MSNQRNNQCPCGSGKKYKNCCKDKVHQDGDALYEQLKEQIQFLKVSAQLYDSGMKIEAKRLSTNIRNLVHDTDKSISLLMSLNKKNVLYYDTSTNYNPKNLLSHSGLARHKITAGSIKDSGWVPILDDGLASIKKVSFNEWWDKAVIVDDKRRRFTRKSLVLNLCNTDGGSHIDPKLRQDYADLTRNNSMGFKIQINGVEYEEDGIHLTSVRQIAHELLKTLNDEFPECFQQDLA